MHRIITVKSANSKGVIMENKYIIQSLCELVEDKTIVEDEEYAKYNDESIKLYRQILDRLGEDKEAKETLNKYDMSEGLRESVGQELFFREGFISGVRLALEILGYRKSQ